MRAGGGESIYTRGFTASPSAPRRPRRQKAETRKKKKSSTPSVKWNFGVVSERAPRSALESPTAREVRDPGVNV